MSLDEILLLSLNNVTAKEYKIYQAGQVTSELQQKLNALRYSDVDTFKALLKEEGITPITIHDKIYPAQLKEIYDPPYVLYMKGNLEILKLRMLGVVGSRKATSYTTSALDMLFQDLDGLAIVSGLAYGADENAHRIALKYGLKTVAVLAFGHSIHYPKTTLTLRRNIEKDGLVISEYPPLSKIEKWKFIARNRIIAGLSDAVLVTEAEEKSGSLVTLEMAINENKTAMCLPGNITSKLSKGTNMMISEGAKTVLNSGDIIEEIFPL